MDSKAIQFQFHCPFDKLLVEAAPGLSTGFRLEMSFQRRQYEANKEIYQNCERLITIKEVNV